MPNSDFADYVKANAKQLFGSQFWEARLVCKAEIGPKADKTESRILVLSKFRLFFLSGKIASKLHVENSFHLLSLSEIVASGVQSEITLTVDGRRTFIRLTDQTVTSHDLAIHLLTAFKHYFPTCDVHRFIDLSPTSLYAAYAQLPSARPTLPCNGFRRTYASLCDFYKQLFRDEIVWDVEKIYSLHNSTVLRLDDFSHLSPKDLIPLLSALQFSSWFTGIASETLKLSNDVIEIIILVLRKSQRIKELTLRNCGLKFEFLISMAQALTQNPSIPLETIDLSGNTFDDHKSVATFSQSLASLNSHLKSISFEDCCLNSKATNAICSALQRNQERNDSHSLATLNVAKNPFKDDLSELYHLICHSSSITYLNLSGTGLPLEKLWSALKSCAHSITTLKLSGCVFTARKSTKDLTVPTAVKDFFASASSLKTVDFSDCVLPAEILKFLLLGLVINTNVDDVALDLTRSCTEKACISHLETCMPNLTVVTELVLRDCGLEQDALILLPAVGRMPKLRRLDIGGNNFVGTRKQQTKNIKNILIEIVKLISDEDSPLRELCLSDCRIGVSLCVLLNALGVAPRLKSLDIAGNDIGNFGARLLAKALQVNGALETLLIDRNQITFEGYSDIVHALKENSSLLSMPYPLYDAAESLKLNKDKTEFALNEIERSLRRNNNNYGFTSCVEASSWIYETHSKLLLGNVEDELNKVASRTAQLLNEFEHEESADVTLAIKLLQETENAKSMVDKLLSVVDEGDFILDNAKVFADSLTRKVDENLKTSAIIFSKFPSNEEYSMCQNTDFLAGLQNACLQKAQLEVNISVQDFGKALRQRYSAVQFNLATTVSEKVCQELVKSLTNVNKRLSNCKKLSLSGSEKLSTSGTPTGKKKFKFFPHKRPLSIVEGHGVPNNFADLADDQDGSSENFDNNSIENNEDAKISEETSLKDGTLPLMHIQKDRAKPRRNHKVKAPQPPHAADEGVDNFFIGTKGAHSVHISGNNDSNDVAKTRKPIPLVDDHRFNLKIDVSEPNTSEKRVSRMPPPGMPSLTPGVLQQLGSKLSPRGEPVIHEVTSSTAPKVEHVVVTETSNYPKVAKMPPPKPPVSIGVKLPVSSSEELSAALKSPSRETKEPLASPMMPAVLEILEKNDVEPPKHSPVSKTATYDDTSVSSEGALSPTSGDAVSPTSNGAVLSFTATSTPISVTSGAGNSETADAKHTLDTSIEISSSEQTSSDALYSAKSVESESERDVLHSNHTSSLTVNRDQELRARSVSTEITLDVGPDRPIRHAHPPHFPHVNPPPVEFKSTEAIFVSDNNSGNNEYPTPPKLTFGRPERPPLPSKPPPARPPPLQRVWDPHSTTSDDSSAGVNVSMREKLDPSAANNADHRKSVLEMRRVFEASKAHHASMIAVSGSASTELKPVPPPRVRATNKVAPTD